MSGSPETHAPPPPPPPPPRSMSGSPETHAPPPPSEASGNPNPQAPNINNSQNLVNGGQQMFPMFYPLLVPGSIPLQNPEENNHGAGLYAVPFSPFIGPMAGPSPSTLIPLKFNIPTTNSTGLVGDGPGQEARQQLGPQRQIIVRRFQFAIQLDLSLILKLAAAVFLFNQEGSRQRLILLVFFATLVYLYQTGVLSPFLRWIRRGAAPPLHRPAVPPENAPLVGHDNGNEPRPEDNAGDEDPNQPAGTEGAGPVNEGQQEPERRNGINWLIIMKEIQTIVVGFVSSLLPGFHHND